MLFCVFWNVHTWLLVFTNAQTSTMRVNKHNIDYDNNDAADDDNSRNIHTHEQTHIHSGAEYTTSFTSFNI